MNVVSRRPKEIDYFIFVMLFIFFPPSNRLLIMNNFSLPFFNANNSLNEFYISVLMLRSLNSFQLASEYK